MKLDKVGLLCNVSFQENYGLKSLINGIYYVLIDCLYFINTLYYFIIQKIIYLGYLGWELLCLMKDTEGWRAGILFLRTPHVTELGAQPHVSSVPSKFLFYVAEAYFYFTPYIQISSSQTS